VPHHPGQALPGLDRIAHGGIVCTLLDEIMAYAVLGFIGQGVTANFEHPLQKTGAIAKAGGGKRLDKGAQGRRAVAQGEIRSSG
jgi:acyl-coenzyme A thioesterase PaaI-like protein